MIATERLKSLISWAIAAGVGVGAGLGLAAFLIDQHVNHTCGLIPATVGLILVIPAGLAVAALISLVAATRDAADTRRMGTWLLIVVVCATVVFFVAGPMALQQLSSGCHRA